MSADICVVCRLPMHRYGTMADGGGPPLGGGGRRHTPTGIACGNSVLFLVEKLTGMEEQVPMVTNPAEREVLFQKVMNALMSMGARIDELSEPDSDTPEETNQ